MAMLDDAERIAMYGSIEKFQPSIGDKNPWPKSLQPIVTKKINETLAMVAKAAKASKGDLSDLREALEVFAVYHLVGPRNFALLPDLSRLQQVGYASRWLASDREFPDPLLYRQLSCNLFAVQGESFFRAHS
jgi:hypothetical protein